MEVRVRRRRALTLALALALGLFAGGVFTHALLFPFPTAPEDPDALAQVDRAANPPAPAPDLELELEDLSIGEAYQRITQALTALASRRQGPALKAEIEALTEQIERLRVLNPYYRFKEIQAQAIPRGVPATYGQALGVSFDEVQASLNVLKAFDPTYGREKIALTGEDLERYIRVGSRTACKYCCSAKALVRADGTAACGCAHSQAMRGLAAYIITNHPLDYSDEALVDELNRWRAVFFPKQTLTEALQARQAAGEPGIEEVLTEFPEFLPQMVGNC